MNIIFPSNIIRFVSSGAALLHRRFRCYEWCSCSSKTQRQQPRRVLGFRYRLTRMDEAEKT
jgi:hypothetical protein